MLKHLSFAIQSAFLIVVYAAYRWVSRSIVLDPLEPRCGMWRTLTKFSLKAPISCWWRLRSTFWKVLNATIAASWAYIRDAVYVPIVPTGMVCAALGLVGGTTGVAKRVV